MFYKISIEKNEFVAVLLKTENNFDVVQDIVAGTEERVTDAIIDYCFAIGKKLPVKINGEMKTWRGPKTLKNLVSVL